MIGRLAETFLPTETTSRRVEILPSLMCADLLRVADQLARLRTVGVRHLHIDVMDGSFVPNFMFGTTMVQQLRRNTDFRLEVHLMTRTQETHVDRFLEAGAHVIQFHPEAADAPGDLIRRIRRQGASPGLVLQPALPLKILDPWLDALDHCLLMSAPPGFAGQAFDLKVFDRIRRLADLRSKRALDFEIGCDGSVRRHHLRRIVKAGADRIVVGRVLFDTGRSLPDSLNDLRRLCHKAAEPASTRSSPGPTE